MTSNFVSQRTFNTDILHNELDLPTIVLMLQTRVAYGTTHTNERHQGVCNCFVTDSSMTEEIRMLQQHRWPSSHAVNQLYCDWLRHNFHSNQLELCAVWDHDILNYHISIRMCYKVQVKLRICINQNLLKPKWNVFSQCIGCEDVTFERHL